MNDIRDALRKAGLIDKKTEKRLEHEERVRKKGLGRDGRAKERQDAAAGHQQRQASTRQDVRQAQERHNQEQDGAAQRKRAVQRVVEEELRRTSGPLRFHYRDPNGLLPFVPISEDIARRLESGTIGLVAKNAGHDTALVPRDVAVELSRVLPERLLFLAGQRS